MKAQILKHLRTRWAKTNKAIPVGLDAVELDKRAEIIASGLQKSGYDGPIDANLINLIEAEREKIKSLSNVDLNEMATKLGLNDPNKNRFLRKDNVVDMEGNVIPDGATIMGGKELKETVEQASKRGSPEGVFKAMQNDPEYSDIMKEFALEKKFPTRTAEGEEAIPLAMRAKFDDEMGIKSLPDRDYSAEKLISDFRKYGKATDKDIQLIMSSGKSGQIPYVMDNYGMSYTDVLDTLKEGKPLIEGMAQGGRIGLKDGMDRRTFMKIMGGLATLPIFGKFFKGAKVASKAAPVAEKVVGSTVVTPPPYFFKLAEKIKQLGKESKVKPQERMNEYNYRGKNGDEYTLTEDITTGDMQITKDKTGIGSYGDKSFDTIEDRTVLEYKAPRKDVDVENRKGINESSEYDEYKVEFDQDGTEAGADAIDEVVQKEIIEEAGKNVIKKASGGRVGLAAGKFVKLVQLLKNKKKIDQAVDNIFPTGDYKMDAEMAAESLVELNPKVFGNKLYEDLDDRTRIDIYGAVINQVQKNNLMASKMKKASKPTKTLEGIEKTGTIDISDPAVAEEFARFMKETSPGDAKKVEQTVELMNFDPKGRKKNNAGGVAYMLGE